MTFAAVGSAMTAWETLEAHLSHLYSIFIGKPLLADALEQYGRDSKIFKDRMNSLCEAGRVFFVASPSQEYEAILDGIIREAKRLAVFRHQIAHGLVVSLASYPGIPTESGMQIPLPAFLLMPPSHGLFHLTKTTGHYRYGAKEINEYADEFYALGTKVQNFNRTLLPSL